MRDWHRVVLAGVMLVVSLSLVGVVNGAGGPYRLGADLGEWSQRIGTGWVVSLAGGTH